MVEISQTLVALSEYMNFTYSGVFINKHACFRSTVESGNSKLGFVIIFFLLFRDFGRFVCYILVKKIKHDTILCNFRLHLLYNNFISSYLTSSSFLV